MHYFFDFHGRTGRLGYWLFAPISAVSLFLLITLSSFAGKVGGEGLAISAFFVACLPLLAGGFAVPVRRLHDRGKSGWWLLAFCGFPSLYSTWTLLFVGLPPTALLPSEGMIAFSVWLAGSPVADALSLMLYALVLWGVVELGFLRGTAGPNRYGPDPLQQAAAP